MATTLSSGLRSAKELLQKFGVLNERKSELVSLLDRVADVDQERVTAIAEVIQYMDDFNELIRNNVADMQFSDRYNNIDSAFTSIREDSERLVQQVEGDGKISFWEKWSNKIRFVLKGTPHDRFLDAIETFYKVCEDVKGQLGKENNILQGYQDFREIYAEAGIIALEVKEKQKTILDQAADVFKSAVDVFEAYTGEGEAEKARLKLEVDKAERAYKAEQRNYKLLTSVSQDLSTSYDMTRTLVERLEMTHDNKDDLHQRSVSFVETHETAFTILDATYASLYGLNEMTRSFQALKTGMNEGVRQIGRLGRKVDNEAIAQTYGVTVDPEAVKELNTNMTDHMRERVTLMEEHMTKQAEAVLEIRDVTDKGIAERRKIAYEFLQDEKEAAVEKAYASA